MNYQDAKNQLILGNTLYTEWFKQNNYFLEYAYSLVFLKELSKAQFVIKQYLENDIRADWLSTIITILQGNNPKKYPSFLQVRNFFEVDISLFLQIGLRDYILNLLNCCDLFFLICKESYKFAGRALYYYGEKELALEFLLKAKDKFYNDSETHFLLAKLYKDIGDSENCRKYVNICLNYLPEYKPALDILNEINY